MTAQEHLRNWLIARDQVEELEKQTAAVRETMRESSAYLDAGTYVLNHRGKRHAMVVDNGTVTSVMPVVEAD